MFQRNVSGAQFVGQLRREGATNCIGSLTGTSYAEYPTDTDCANPVVIGDISATATKTPNVIINNARTDGVYHVNLTLGLVADTSNGNCSFVLTSDSTNVGFIEVSRGATAGTERIKQMSGVFRYTSNGQKEIALRARRDVSTPICSYYNNSDYRPLIYDITFIPDSTNTIVTQNTELTAQSANEFVANVSSTGVVSGENFDWINGNCTLSDTSLYTCDISNTFFEQRPSCTTSTNNSNRVILYSLTSTKDSLIFRTRSATTDVNAAADFTINCTRSTDYR